MLAPASYNLPAFFTFFIIEKISFLCYNKYMDKVKIKKELFEILKKFSLCEETLKDCQRFCEIMYYENPYKSRIVFPTKRENLAVKVKRSIGFSYGQSRHEWDKKKNQYKKQVDIFYKKKDMFIHEVLNTLGHEYTHNMQEDAIIDFSHSGYVPSLQTTEVLDSMQYGAFQDNGYQFIKYLNKAIEVEYLNNFDISSSYISQKELEKLYTLSQLETLSKLKHPNVHKRVKSDIRDYSYAQLKYEQNATDCGFEFAREMLEAFTEDPLCDDYLANYLLNCAELLGDDWKEELDNRQAPQFLFVKDEYERLLKQSSNIPAKIINKVRRAAKIQLITAKLFQLRKSGASKEDYLKQLLELKYEQELPLRSYSYLYLYPMSKSAVEKVVASLGKTRKIKMKHLEPIIDPDEK